LRGFVVDLRTVDSADVYVSATRRLPFGLISDPQSLTNFQHRLRVPPFTSGLPAAGPMFYPHRRHRQITGTRLYDYYGFICRPPSHHGSRLRVA